MPFYPLGLLHTGLGVSPYKYPRVAFSADKPHHGNCSFLHSISFPPTSPRKTKAEQTEQLERTNHARLGERGAALQNRSKWISSIILFVYLSATWLSEQTLDADKVLELKWCFSWLPLIDHPLSFSHCHPSCLGLGQENATTAADTGPGRQCRCRHPSQVRGCWTKATRSLHQNRP